MTLREELMMSMALRAGEMDALDCIDLDGTVEGEHELCMFIDECVDEWMGTDFNPYEFDENGNDCFDLFIESKLETKYRKGLVKSQFDFGK